MSYPSPKGGTGEKDRFGMLVFVTFASASQVKTADVGAAPEPNYKALPSGLPPLWTWTGFGAKIASIKGTIFHRKKKIT
jgi:hypothetical protein